MVTGVAKSYAVLQFSSVYQPWNAYTSSTTASGAEIESPFSADWDTTPGSVPIPLMSNATVYSSLVVTGQ